MLDTQRIRAARDVAATLMSYLGWGAVLSWARSGHSPERASRALSGGWRGPREGLLLCDQHPPKSDSGWCQALGTQETSLTHVKEHQLVGLLQSSGSPVPGLAALSGARPCDKAWVLLEVGAWVLLSARHPQTAGVSACDLFGVRVSLPEAKCLRQRVLAQKVRTRCENTEHAHACGLEKQSSGKHSKVCRAGYLSKSVVTSSNALLQEVV